jgi:(E)-4-hydroxy-3-methylbut-2-enyl-diphosphate synthase
MPENYKYCESLAGYVRRKSRVVTIGDVPLGGEYPIRIQSMTTTDTMDTVATIDESIRMITAGCEYVRITAPSIREAENLKNIKDGLRKKGYKTPLIADIHYTPNAAEAAARIVEKVRINPGNFADKKRFRTIEYTDKSYNAEIERIHKRFSPLVKICRENGTAMRIGVNHGSLSDRILSRYGDTPLGMVESALEFIRICEDYGYQDIALSMKSSNPIVMIHAYRLLVNRMDKEGMDYPLHLGVTEAGEGEDGRIKSALGIGTLLEDGLGDTIRVSLTEPPENEIPAAQKILNRYMKRKPDTGQEYSIKFSGDPFKYARRVTRQTGIIGGREVPRVIADLSNETVSNEKMAEIGYFYHPEQDVWKPAVSAADFIYIGNNEVPICLSSGIKLICDYEKWRKLKDEYTVYPLIDYSEISSVLKLPKVLKFIVVKAYELNNNFKRFAQEIKKLPDSVLILESDESQSMRDFRSIFFRLIENGIDLPVILKHRLVYPDKEEAQINASIDIGGALVEGLGDGVWLNPATEFYNNTVFGILQASRTRITKPDYISCPSCGRTLFDLQKVSAIIRERTDHLIGLKIGIMGCIVNGPGEMADADYGYVGAGPGKVSLYRGQNAVKTSIPESNAVDELILLIKEDNRWIEK